MGALLRNSVSEFREELADRERSFLFEIEKGRPARRTEVLSFGASLPSPTLLAENDQAVVSVSSISAMRLCR